MKLKTQGWQGNSPTTSRHRSLLHPDPSIQKTTLERDGYSITKRASGSILLASCLEGRRFAPNTFITISMNRFLGSKGPWDTIIRSTRLIYKPLTSTEDSPS